MREDIYPEIEVDKVRLIPPDPPAWWPEGREYTGLTPGYAYRDRDGKWRDAGGYLLNRKARRRHGLA